MNAPTSASTKAQELLQRWQDLANRCSELGQLTQDAGRAMLEQTAPPASQLIDSLAAFHQQFARLRESVVSWHGNGSTNGEGLSTLSELAERIRHLADREIVEVEGRTWRNELDDLTRLTHLREPNFPPLQTALTQVRDCLAKLTVISDVGDLAAFRALLEEGKPLRDLWAVVTEHEDLDETNGQEALARVSTAFGTAMLTALALRRLQISAPPEKKEEVPTATAAKPTPSAAAVPALAAALKDDSKVVRIKAVRGLAQLGSAARSAIPALREVTQDKDDGVRREAAAAIRLIQGNGAKH